MEFPEWVNVIELVIAGILIFNFIGNFPSWLITILGIILIIDVIIDLVNN